MAERRTKVYQGRQEQERDEAEAVAHGWRVVSRDSGRRGYTVVYELDPAFAPATTQPTGSGGVRKVTWLFILWNLAFLVLVVVGAYREGLIGGTTRATIDSIARSSLLVGLAVAWFVGVVLIGFLWFRGRARA